MFLAWDVVCPQAGWHGLFDRIYSAGQPYSLDTGATIKEFLATFLLLSSTFQQQRIPPAQFQMSIWAKLLVEVEVILFELRKTISGRCQILRPLHMGKVSSCIDSYLWAKVEIKQLPEMGLSESCSFQFDRVFMKLSYPENVQLSCRGKKSAFECLNIFFQLVKNEGKNKQLIHRRGFIWQPA